MILYMDKNGIIYDVKENTTGNESLIRVEINDEDNPFAGWSKGKICCYKCQIIDGRVTMMTPVVDSRIIRNFDIGSIATEAITPYKQTKTAYIYDEEITFKNVPKGNLTVYMQDAEGSYLDYTIEREKDIVTIHFEPLENVTEVTISVI